MDEKKIAFLRQLVPSQFECTSKTILHCAMESNGRYDVALIDIVPSDETLQAFRSQKSLPPGIVFERTPYVYEKNASGIQGQKNVIAIRIDTSVFRASPYGLWFADHPRLVSGYVLLVAILAGLLYWNPS